MKMTSQEWIDVGHTVVPVAYLDFVLLDKRWCEFIRQEKIPANEIAKVHSRAGLDAFFEDLQNWRENDGIV